jgi:hypothetical protein
VVVTPKQMLSIRCKALLGKLTWLATTYEYR